MNILADSNIFCVFIFILIVSANFLAELFPCRLQYVLRNNMFVKHTFGLFTMIFFVVLSSGIKKNIHTIVRSSFLLYVLFILITKCQIYAFYIILFLLGLTYILHLVKQELEQSEKETKTKQSKDYDNIINVLYSLILLFVVLGVILYMGEKKIEYKKDFNYITFFIGNSVCKGKSPTVNVIESFKNAFN